MNVEVCEVLTKPNYIDFSSKMALQKWSHKFMQQKNSKNYHIKNVTFQIHSNKITQILT
jgi:hypothetical protein